MMRAAVTLPLIAILAACTSQRGRPPYASQDDDEEPTRDNDAAATFAPLPDGTDDPCETLVELPIVKPNFYFVIDASGSMLERMPGSNQSRYRTAVRAISDMLEGVQTRVNFGAAVFPNTFAGASCEAGNEVFPLQDGERPGDTSTLQALNLKLQAYTPEGGSPVSPTLSELYPTIRAFEGDTYVFLLSDGAPNCNLARPCEAEECILNIEGATFDDGTVCDESLNCCAPDWFPHLCLDRDPTLDELKRLSDDGVDTYIIGMPGGAPYATLLNDMAVAAGTARGRAQPSVDAGVVMAEAGAAVGDAAMPASTADELASGSEEELLYYQISDAQSLAAALANLSREILIDCTLQLDFAPNKPDLLQVTADGEVLTKDQWTLASATEVELLGQACEDWKAGRLPEVRVQQTCRGTVR